MTCTICNKLPCICHHLEEVEKILREACSHLHLTEWTPPRLAEGQIVTVSVKYCLDCEKLIKWKFEDPT